ncbi:hypothetical protein Undi14_11860 [Undibacterium sp. 14-3-2]|uniref:hypothetical protein n=1 Tax=Undibacterium sp. 14-3-2 TaxID=2800129 RepID=UPI00190457E8|nr:hypothetical protein [Undibacterium sp. 14-3-2]MBK1890729.1 hypothetical protein [Undibacterium sp. 14-3-2]
MSRQLVALNNPEIQYAPIANTGPDSAKPKKVASANTIEMSNKESVTASHTNHALSSKVVVVVAMFLAMSSVFFRSF